mmetsp:Transcript_21271/g.35170  ORF Transcript_21271/g.35170 Transcript_21271/m.35170 type:complete len:486 (+) Transcript_21271:1176-2633(+)
MGMGMGGDGQVCRTRRMTSAWTQTNENDRDRYSGVIAHTVALSDKFSLIDPDALGYSSCQCPREVFELLKACWTTETAGTGLGLGVGMGLARVVDVFNRTLHVFVAEGVTDTACSTALCPCGSSCRFKRSMTMPTSLPSSAPAPAPVPIATTPRSFPLRSRSDSPLCSSCLSLSPSARLGTPRLSPTHPRTPDFRLHSPVPVVWRWAPTMDDTEFGCGCAERHECDEAEWVSDVDGGPGPGPPHHRRQGQPIVTPLKFKWVEQQQQEEQEQEQEHSDGHAHGNVKMLLVVLRLHSSLTFQALAFRAFFLTYVKRVGHMRRSIVFCNTEVLRALVSALRRCTKDDSQRDVLCITELLGLMWLFARPNANKSFLRGRRTVELVATCMAQFPLSPVLQFNGCFCLANLMSECESSGQVQADGNSTPTSLGSGAGAATASRPRPRRMHLQANIKAVNGVIKALRTLSMPPVQQAACSALHSGALRCIQV